MFPVRGAGAAPKATVAGMEEGRLSADTTGEVIRRDFMAVGAVTPNPGGLDAGLRSTSAGVTGRISGVELPRPTLGL